VNDIYCLDLEESWRARIEERLRELEERLALVELDAGCEVDASEVAKDLAPVVAELLAEAT
jgi:hypothetical protein